jgi:predicted AAA+ superfamily ATPase
MYFLRILSLPLDTTDHSIFLLGPRGTGKTSYLRDRLPDCIYLDLLDDSLYARLRAHPSRLEKLIPSNYKDWIIIDEVQKIPQLLNEVHRLIEHKKYKFILTGSSARSLRKKGVNLLAGRALRYFMHPLIIQEMDDQFDIKQALQIGLLPSVVTRSHPERYLESYTQMYLKEEVAQEGLRQNLDIFTAFLEVSSFSQGQLVNYSEISRELGIDRRIVRSYFTILEDMLLATCISPFTKRAK